MPLPAIIAPIVGAIGSIAKSWLETRKVKAEGRIAIAKAKVEAKVQKQNLLGQMDLAAVNDMRFSWKDEFLIVLLSIPVIMCFIPPLTPYVAQGFVVLETTPEWYRWAFLGAVVASFGLRTWMGWKK